MKMKTDRTYVPLSVVNRLEKRMGVKIWDGILYENNGIIDPLLKILPTKAGRELRELLAIDEIENCSHAPCVCGQVRQFTASARARQLKKEGK